ncbi:MAG: hypothetical protein E7254_00220 [Lachnospiraceae bacterium]|nr:hypothetical protein [Lachnospiraceae bacterium]
MRKLKKVVAIVMSAVLLTSGFSVSNPVVIVKQVKAAGIESSSFLKASGKVLKNNYGNGNVVYLRGTNAGSLSVQENWMCTFKWTQNVKDQSDIWRVLTQRFGEGNARTLIRHYMDSFWTTADFDRCASLGLNVIRLPLWYRDFVDSNGNWYSDCWNYVDWFVSEGAKRGIYTIIDMHGAYGSQNGSDHSGVDGQDYKEAASQFFFGGNAASNQEKYYQMWEKIAEHFRGNAAVAGYDLLNEPYCTYRYSSSVGEDQLHSILYGVYDRVYDRIRAKDPDHLIIMEATWDSWDLPNPNDYGWSNVMYEYHQYEYSNYNNEDNKQITSLQNKINNIFAMNHNVPSYMGEFNMFNSDAAWDTALQMLNNNGINWTTWTYKALTSNDNWGLWKYSGEQVDIEYDSYDTIYNKWSGVTSSYENTYITNVLKKYVSGTVSGPGTDYSNISAGSYYLQVTGNDGAKVVCAENGGESPLVANRDNCGGAWETLEVVDNGDGTVAFKSVANGKYVCAVIDENNQLLPRSNQVSDWEKFRLVNIQGNQYGIYACANGKYVKADFGLEGNVGELRASSDSVAGSWEAFTFNKIGGEEPTVAPTVKPTETQTEKPTDGYTDSVLGQWAYVGNWGCYFGGWNGTASGRYYCIPDYKSFTLEVNQANKGVDWLVQASYETNVSTGKTYDVSVDVYSTKAASIGIKEDLSNGGEDQKYQNVNADQKITLKGRYTVTQDKIKIMFELGRGVDAGTKLIFDNVRISEVQQDVTTQAPTQEPTIPIETTVKEEPTWNGDYASLSWTRVGNSDYYVAAGGNEFGFELLEAQEAAVHIVPKVAEGTKPIWPDYSNVTLNGANFNQPAGAGIMLPYTSLPQGYSVFKANSAVDGHTFEIIIRNDKKEEPTETSTEKPTEKITEAPTEAPTEKPTETPTQEVKISSDIEINGFQMSTNTFTVNGTSFEGGIRTVYSVKDKVDGQNVQKFGIIYGLVGVTPESELLATSTNNTVIIGQASAAGQLDKLYSKTMTDAKSYAMTLTLSSNNITQVTVAELTANYYVRAYVQLADGTYRYTNVRTFSVFHVADNLYQNIKMSNYSGHEYLYNNILKKVDPTYKEVEYDWGKILAKPSDLK